MVARLIKNSLFRGMLLGLVAFGIFLTPTVYAAEEFGACTYSSGDYSVAETCDEHTGSGGLLSSTGDSQKLLVILALSMIATGFGIAVIVRVLRKRQPRE